MQQIKNMEFSGERPLFASHDLQLFMPGSRH